MKNYLELVSISAKKHKKQNRLTIFCIAVAVFLVTVIFGLADMEVRSQKRMEIANNGEWHAMFTNVSLEDAACIAARPDIAYAGWYDYPSNELTYTISEKEINIYCMDTGMPETILDQKMTEGEFPADENEIMITDGMMKDLNIHTGDTVTIMEDGKNAISLTVSGIFKENSVMASNQKYVGVCAPKTYYQHFESDQTKGYYMVMFHSFVNIRRSIQEIKDTIQIADADTFEHTVLLATMGQSQDKSMMMLYMTAAGLFVLVMFAGIFMIAASINSSIERRTEFFGMLRCIGASKKQIMRMVYKEGFLWSIRAIPIGVIPGIIVTSGICLMLKLLSPSYFKMMPVFECSPISVICGILMGLITVFLASRVPAKRAASVSPLAAVLGQANERMRIKGKRARNIGKVDRYLGCFHARANRRNYIFMVFSFAFSIILFLSFTIMIDFMNHAVKPLRPWSPDLSIVDDAQTCSIPAEYCEKIMKMDGVSSAYGRMFSYALPVKSDTGDMNANLISYEENQFKWAQKYISEGNIENVRDNLNQIFIVYHIGMNLKTGDKLQLFINQEWKEVTVGGILTSSPFDSAEGEETMICSEETFRTLTGQKDYTIIDIQLKGKNTDATADDVRALANTPLKNGTSFGFLDDRATKAEIKGGFYSFALFVYGFLFIIALITVINIMNSMNMSFTAHLRQYGEMRAVGMSDKQLMRMVFYEALTYAFGGSCAGIVIGLLCNKVFFEQAITYRWGDAWKVPGMSIFVIVFLVVLGVSLSLAGPYKRIKDISIVETINAQ